MKGRMTKTWADTTLQARGGLPCSQLVCPDCGLAGREFHADWTGRADRPKFEVGVCWYECGACGKGLFWLLWGSTERPRAVGRRR